MASIQYTVATVALKNGELDMEADVIKARAVSTATYTPDAAHASMTPVLAYQSGGVSAVADCEITTRGTGTVLPTGVYDFTDITLAFEDVAIDGTDTITGFVFFKFVTDDAGSMPIVYLELASPYTPNGGDINLLAPAGGIWK